MASLANELRLDVGVGGDENFAINELTADCLGETGPGVTAEAPDKVEVGDA